jgi:hypothetical protein
MECWDNAINGITPVLKHSNSQEQLTVSKKSIIPVEAIERRILLIRRQKVMLDSDLAQLYGVSTKRLNEQVKRNRKRFPSDFMFQLSEQEKSEVVANCDHLKNLKFSPVLPSAFTEHGGVIEQKIRSTKSEIRNNFK